MRDKLIHQSTLYFDDAVVHDPPRLVNQVGYFSKPRRNRQPYSWYTALAGIDSQVTVLESSPSRLPGGALLDGHLLEGTATLTPHWLPSPPLGKPLIKPAPRRASPAHGHAQLFRPRRSHLTVRLLAPAGRKLAHHRTKPPNKPLSRLARSISQSAHIMARGNQRDQARAKAQKAASSVTLTDVDARLQKSKNNMSGTEFAKAKEAAADIMRQKQAAAEAKKAAEAGKK
ncbi:hypothetical protein ACCO45_003796 [Purpureocillium lilacinum]|uniref:Uncharacterized protein n=1 Tax=Purpureocillium lilacinum TaxID=33203 RepID=A0ACC4E425_PURLI